MSLFQYYKITIMSRVKRKPMTQSSVLLGGLSNLENKENLNGDEIKEMIELLKAYETLCIQRQDFNGADSVKSKIQHLKEQQLIYRKQTIAVREKEQIEQICKEGEKEVKEFQFKWDIEIKNLIEELKKCQDQLVQQHKIETENFLAQLASQQVPKIKYSSHILERRKYLSNLIKARNYKQAQIVKNHLKQLEAQEEVKWAQKFEEKKKIKIEKLQKKQLAQLQVLRVKLEGVFNEKIKERDRKFDILLKKNRKRRIESSKPSRERVRSRNGILTESKLNFNASGHI